MQTSQDNLSTQSDSSSNTPPEANAAAFVGDIPKVYETHLGPHLFEFAAADLVRRVGDSVPDAARLLEVACGTGIATEHLWTRFRKQAEIVATDLNPAMLEYAVRVRGLLSNVTWTQADALALPFDDGSFDAAVCQFGMMFFPDRAAGVREMTRVTRPGGCVALNVWGSFEANPFIRITQEVIEECCPEDAPKFLHVPFGDYDVAEITGRFESAGLIDVEVTEVTEQIVCDPQSLARGLIEGTPGVTELRRLANVDIEEVVARLTAAFTKEFATDRCRIPMTELAFVGRVAP